MLDRFLAIGRGTLVGYGYEVHDRLAIASSAVVGSFFFFFFVQVPGTWCIFGCEIRDHLDPLHVFHLAVGELVVRGRRKGAA